MLCLKTFRPVQNGSQKRKYPESIGHVNTLVTVMSYDHLKTIGSILSIVKLTFEILYYPENRFLLVIYSFFNEMLCGTSFCIQ